MSLATHTPTSDRAGLLAYVDEIRERLVRANDRGKRTGKSTVRLTLAGLIARLLSFPRYRGCGFTTDLFRQALFTTLLEANIAPSRMTQKSLDSPIGVASGKGGKPEWPDEFWNFLGVFGPLIENSRLDDPEVEAFAENAVSILTFHQSKGLEFDHVYVGATGRDASPHSVLRTKVFSGETPKFKLDADEQPTSRNKDVLELSEADREREIYVAMTRAKRTLTILHDPTSSAPFMGLNAGIASLFKSTRGKRHPTCGGVTVKEYK